MSEVIEKRCERKMSWPKDFSALRSCRRRVVDPKATVKDPGAARDFWQFFARNFEIKIRELLQEQRFEKLAAAWKSETKFLSNMATKVMHPAYQQIIGMGEDALPHIFRDLSDYGPNDWFWALHAITQENPITEDMAGNMTAMTEAWLQWGEKEGHLKGYRPKTSGTSRV